MGAGFGKRRSGPCRSRSLVFQRPFPLAGHGDLRSGDWVMVLVYRPVHRAARFGCAERADRPPRQHFRRFPQALPGLLVHYSWTDLLRAGYHREQVRRATDRLPGPYERIDEDPADRQHRPARAEGGEGRGATLLPADGQGPLAGGPAGHRRRRLALGLDGLTGRRVQRLLDALHRRSLRKAEGRAPRSTRSSAWAASLRRSWS